LAVGVVRVCVWCEEMFTLSCEECGVQTQVTIQGPKVSLQVLLGLKY